MHTNTDLDFKMLAEDYGFPAAFYKSDKSLQRLINQATEHQWSVEVFGARLQNTAWWKKHTDAQRKWIEQTYQDPKQAAADRSTRRAQITEMARQQGVTLTKNRLDQLVQTSLYNGFDSDLLQNAVAAEFDYQPGHAVQGLAGATVDQLREMAHSYVVPISNSNIEKWTQQVLAGDATPESFQDYMRTQAKSMFPALTKQIDAGVTVDQYLDPYKQQASNVLGINPDEVDWTDPKWQQIVFAIDPKTQERTIKSLADAATILRTDKRFGFDQSANGRDAAAQLASQLQSMFTGTGG